VGPAACWPSGCPWSGCSTSWPARRPERAEDSPRGLEWAVYHSSPRYPPLPILPVISTLPATMSTHGVRAAGFIVGVVATATTDEARRRAHQIGKRDGGFQALQHWRRHATTPVPTPRAPTYYSARTALVLGRVSMSKRRREHMLPTAQEQPMGTPSRLPGSCALERYFLGWECGDGARGHMPCHFRREWLDQHDHGTGPARRQCDGGNQQHCIAWMRDKESRTWLLGLETRWPTGR
jgi:hypothetical protein